MDNTLVRANKVHLYAFKRAFEANNLEQVDDKKLLSLFGKPAPVIVQSLFPKLSHRKVLRVVKVHNDYVVKDTARYAKAIPGVKRALKRLKKHFKMALVSNCSHREIVAILASAGIDINLFDIVIGSDEVKRPKPFPNEILKAKKALAAKDCYMIGDTVYDIATGKKAGAKTIAVTTGNQSWDMLEKAGPDYIVKSVAEVPLLFKKLMKLR